MNKKGDTPGWAWIVGLILALVAIVVIIWIAWKSGQIGAQQIGAFR